MNVEQEKMEIEQEDDNAGAAPLLAAAAAAAAAEEELIEFNYQNLYECMTNIKEFFINYDNDINLRYKNLLNEMFGLLKHKWNEKEKINIHEGDENLFNIEDDKPELIGGANHGIYRGYKQIDLDKIKLKKYKGKVVSQQDKNNAINSCFINCQKQKCLVFGDIHGDIFPLIKVLKSNAITIGNLNTCEIIFLGDIYDPFNNEFIISNNNDNTMVEFGGNIDVSGNKLFNRKLQYFATNDMYLSIIFIMFLAYNKATVYWILGNHDINSCALNPFFYALMRLIKNDNIKCDGCNGDIIEMIQTIQQNLFICEKMFYKFNIGGIGGITKKIFFTHVPQKVYQLEDNLFDDGGTSCIGRIKQEFNLGDPDANLYYMTFFNDFNVKDPNYCKRTKFSTYRSAIVKDTDGIASSDLICDDDEDLDKKIFWDLWVCGHTYRYHDEFFTLFDNSIIENKNEVVIEKGDISLDHTTSLYKSTSDVCKGKMNINVTKSDELGKYESNRGDPEFENLKKLIESKNLISGRNGEFIIDIGSTKITRNTGNLLVKLADLFFILDEIYYNFSHINYILDYYGEFNFPQYYLNDVNYMKGFIEKITLYNAVQQDTQKNNLKEYVQNHYDMIRKQILTKSGDDNKKKIMDIRLVYLTINLLNAYEPKESDYKFIRNQIFLKNKHRLINGLELDGPCGYIYYGILDNSDFTLKNVDLTDCYKKKFNCINSLISIERSKLELIKIFKNNNFNNLVGGHQPGAKRNETNLTMNKKSFNRYKKTSNYNKPEYKSLYTMPNTITPSSILPYKISKPRLNLNEVYEYIMKNPFIVKKLYERFYYEGFYHTISDLNLKKINGYYITNYLYKFVYNGNTLKDYDTVCNDKDEITQNCNNIDSFLKLLNPIKNESIEFCVLLKTFSCENAIKYICKHSNDYAWEIDYFITKINKDLNNTQFQLEIENSYINDEILQIAEFFTNKLYYYNNGKIYHFKKVLMRFVELSLKYFQTIQEMNMIINYIRYHLYENNILIDKRFALHIFYYVLQNLK